MLTAACLTCVSHTPSLWRSLQVGDVLEESELTCGHFCLPSDMAALAQKSVAKVAENRLAHCMDEFEHVVFKKPDPYWPAVDVLRCTPLMGLDLRR